MVGDITCPMKVVNVYNFIMCHHPHHSLPHRDPHDNAAVVDITCPIKIASIPAPLSQP